MAFRKDKLVVSDLFAPLRAAGMGIWQLTINNRWRELSINQDFLYLLGYTQHAFPSDYQQIKEKIFQPQDSIIFEMDLEACLQKDKDGFSGTYRMWNPNLEDWQRVRMSGVSLRTEGQELLLAGIIHNLDIKEESPDLVEEEPHLWKPAVGIEMSPDLRNLVAGIMEGSLEDRDECSFTIELPTANELQEIVELNHQGAQTLQSLMDSMPLPCTFWNRDMAYIGCNDASARLFGCADKSDLSQNIEKLFPPIQPDGANTISLREKHFAEAFVQGRSSFECNLLTLRGESVPTEVIASRMDGMDKSLVMAYMHDLRELKEKDSVIIRERELLQATLDSSPVCFVILLNGEVRFATTYTSHVLGIDVGDNISDFYIDQDGREQFLQELADDGSISWRMLTLKGAHGQSLNMLSNAFVAEYYGKPCIMAWFLDVTELSMADQRMRLMLDAMPLCCIFWDEDRTVQDCNLAMLKVFDLQSKQDLYDNFFDFSPPLQPNGQDSRELAMSYVEKTFLRGFSQFEWMHQKRNGEPIPTEVTLTRVARGDSFIVVGCLRDLREIREKEAALDKERVLLKTILDSSPVCFVIWVDGIVRFATPYAQDFFGMDIGDSSLPYFMHQQEHAEFFNNILDCGKINWQVVSMRAADGSIKDMLANAFQAEYYDENCVMSWFLDITDMREKERQLSLAKEAAEESTRAKGYFLANMSHEIRTPMNAILGMTQLVLDTDLSHSQRDYLQKAEQSARALLRILNDILDFSKIEAGKMEIELVDFDLSVLLKDLYKVMRTKASSKNINLVLEQKNNVPVSLVGDPLRLNQVLLNITDNAIKFTEKGQVEILVELREHIKENNEVSLLFYIKDSGIGMTSQQVDKLFSAFTQADSSTTRRHGGTGLGMAICKNLVQMMGGHIWATSSPGEGTCFHVSLPFTLSREDYHPVNLSAASSSALATNIRFDGSRILVAEDNLLNQVVIRKMLEKMGCLVSIASNGREAVDMALNGAYDLIFMDIQMPEMDGLIATKILRDYPAMRNMPIVAMTAHAMVGDKEKSLAAGMNEHLTKPVDRNELVLILLQWLRKR